MDNAETEDLHAQTDARQMARMRIVLTLLKQRYPCVDSIMEGEPALLVENGRPLQERLDLERVDLDDILEAARRWRGLERIDQIKFAVLERDGNITIVPR